MSALVQAMYPNSPQNVEHGNGIELAKRKLAGRVGIFKFIENRTYFLGIAIIPTLSPVPEIQLLIYVVLYQC